MKLEMEESGRGRVPRKSDYYDWLVRGLYLLGQDDR
jgi:hypothetical protein